MADFTQRRARTISSTFLLIAFVFVGGTAYAKYARLDFGLWQEIVAAGLVLVFAVFPLIWMVVPCWHPVYKALAAHGDPAKIAECLNAEMKSPHAWIHPFHFTQTYLVYDLSYEFNVVPYASISYTGLDRGIGEDAPRIVVYTWEGRTYRWPRTWMQGLFDPEEVLARIHDKIGYVSK